MTRRSLLVTLLLGSASAGAPLASSPSISAAVPAEADVCALDFMVGEWDATFETFAGTWGDEHAGVAPGWVSASLGPDARWLEVEATTSIEGLGAYVVKRSSTATDPGSSATP